MQECLESCPKRNPRSKWTEVVLFSLTRGVGKAERDRGGHKARKQQPVALGVPQDAPVRLQKDTAVVQAEVDLCQTQRSKLSAR